MIKHPCAGVTYMTLIDELKQKQTEMASWRQHLHQFPEIAYEEAMTSDFVAAKLESFGIEVHRGLGETGVVARNAKTCSSTMGVSHRIAADFINAGRYVTT